MTEPTHVAQLHLLPDARRLQRGRPPAIDHPDAQPRLHEYIGGIARKSEMAGLAVGGVADHVHILLSLSRTVAVAKAVQRLKAGSSKWLKESAQGVKDFALQEGYAAFSVSLSHATGWLTTSFINPSTANK
jgi:hypothetical protein